MYQNRTYRNLVNTGNLIPFKVTVKETDLHIHAEKNLESTSRELILRYRGYLESYIKRNPEFVKTLNPWYIDTPEPVIIQEMAEAGRKAGVGPMAAVAGAIAEHVGKGLLAHTSEVVVENGGDIFLKKDNPVTIAIFAGKSPLSLKTGLQIDPGDSPVSVCTSSGTVGHSLSMGRADAICVVSKSCPLADAVATSMGNRINLQSDIKKAIDFGKSIEGVTGLVAIMGNSIGAWGELEIIPLKGKKG
ncbi:MAG: UPF0280 family protein [Desulfobacteraceae bacterium]|nr:UPF0280 family protein [Desulfobacteraceae bacterium]